MSNGRARHLLTLACVLILFGGCASAPSAQNGIRADNDPYEGWLYKSLTGRKDAAASQQTAAPTGGAVQPATASPWQVGAAGAVIPASAESPAGPPPVIPAELPSASAGGTSIRDVKEKEKEEKKGFDLSDLAPENIYKNIKNSAGYGPNEKIAHDTLQEGKALYAEKKYKEAEAKFATAADRWPDSPVEEDALFMQGESQFFSDQYAKAHDTYGGLLKKYVNTRYLDTVAAREFAIGQYWEQRYDAHPTWPTTPNLTDNTLPMFGTFTYAVQAYERVRQYDPTGPRADAALMALGNLYFRHGQWEEAAQQYDTLRKEYANSKYQMPAHLLDLQAKMRIYQGTPYDDTPLREAKKIADQTLSQFGNKLGPERERVAQARAQIVEEMANREFTRGEYYAQHSAYGAARLYYKSVIDGYPGTEMAKRATARMEQYRNEPNEPPKQFAWLTGIFEPKRQQEQPDRRDEMVTKDRDVEAIHEEARRQEAERK
jgi:outer membrane protein assembly factor BamD (BamD/ComL family)